MGHTFRMCEKGDEERLAAFHREARGTHTAPAFWRWKYFDNPAGPCCVALALEGQRIVGRLGHIPVRVRIGAEERLAAQQVDSDILPEHRKGGTYFQLARMVREESARRDLAFGFGFAVEATTSISTEALGFHVVAPVGRVVKVLDPFHYVADRWGLRALRRWGSGARSITRTSAEAEPDGDDVVDVGEFDASFDRLWELSAPGWVAVVRSSRYLNWRYRSCPGVDYRIRAVRDGGEVAGFVAFHAMVRKGVRYGFLDELLVRPGEPAALARLIDVAVRSLRRDGAVSTVAWLPRSHALHAECRARGFRRRPVPHFLLVTPGANRDVPVGLLRDEARWFYTLGDSDYHLVAENGVPSA